MWRVLKTIQKFPLRKNVLLVSSVFEKSECLSQNKYFVSSLANFFNYKFIKELMRAQKRKEVILKNPQKSFWVHISTVTYILVRMQAGCWVFDSNSDISVLYISKISLVNLQCTRREARIFPHCGFIVTMRAILSFQ
jgi:hypothetical protein